MRPQGSRQKETPCHMQCFAAHMQCFAAHMQCYAAYVQWCAAHMQIVEVNNHVSNGGSGPLILESLVQILSILLLILV